MNVLSFLVILTIVLQVSVLVWVNRSSLTGEQMTRSLILIWVALILTVALSAFYIVAFLHLPRLSPGLILFVLSLLGAGFQLSAMATRTYSARPIRLGAGIVVGCFLIFYLLNTFSA
ncbi:hypothetical protein EHF33_05860 [Deinococcus psychrotolerans]|uniref:Uncharacterized protein n=1 Tax=Deinococcus psychrotolerans TaxID=2489213 RepID=A0A3G8YBN1_9DEIO|nr:hypothetical protein [Deinococcus psychrotolerans]AZI42333.1 hypothetical protein EHF33_05860 [Deinococcus psychrotolerans]